jgi:hypothetical protein
VCGGIVMIMMITLVQQKRVRKRNFSEYNCGIKGNYETIEIM